MTEQKKFLPELKEYKPKDLTKNWFVYYYDSFGKRQRVYRGINEFKTYDERLIALKRLKNEIAMEGVPLIKPLKVKVYEVLADNKPVWRKKTYQTIKSKVDIFFSWCGDRPITNELIKDFFKYLKESRYCTTYNTYHQKLRQMFREAGYEYLFDGVNSVKEYRRPARYFQPHQIERLKMIIKEKNPDLWLFIQFIYYCFIRPGELRHLKASDILFEESQIIIRSEVSKNRKTQYIAIPRAFRFELDFIKNKMPNDYIFPSTNDASKPIGLNTMSTRHRTILRDLGFGHEYKLYSWKHTGAVQAVKAGVSVKELQMQLRHHSLDQVNEYLRQMGVTDMTNLKLDFPAI